MHSLWLKYGVATVMVFATGGVAFFFFQHRSIKQSEFFRSSELVALSEGNRSVRVSDARVVSAREYTLSTPYSAKVDALLVDEGDILGTEGSAILRLDTTERVLELNRYEAELARTKSIITKLERGTRYEDLVISQQKKKSFESAKKSAEQSASQVLYTAFIQSDDAVRNQTDPIFIDPEGSSPNLRFSLTDSGMERDIELERKSLSDRLDTWKDLADSLKSGRAIGDSFAKTDTHLRRVRSYLDRVALAVNGLSAGGDLSQDTIDAWKSAVILARSNVSEVAVSVSEARSVYFAADQNVVVSSRELDSLLAGSDKQDIEAALDASDVAKSQVDIVSEQIGEATVKTPENNLLIKKLIPKKGEFVMEGTPVVIAASPDMEIEADVADTDMRGVVRGAEIIFRSEIFPEIDIRGKLTKIENQEIEKNGSAYFRIHASINLGSLPSDVQLRPGMRGDMIIGTQILGDIISVPRSKVFFRDGQSMVSVTSQETGVIRDKVVEIGVSRGENVEILSGLNVGEHIVESAKK